MKCRLLLTALALSTAAQAQETIPAQYRGYTAINRLIQERVARKNGFELGKYLGEDDSVPQVSGLLSLLGTYQGSDTDAKFRNGDPNSINMILWYIALNGLAAGVASYCAAQTAIPADGELALLPEFAAALLPVCLWPQKSAQADDALFGLWTALMSFDAPPSEYEAWRDYFRTDAEFAQAPASVAVAALVLGALYNPYFLLRN